jgi:hypothetical protein
MRKTSIITSLVLAATMLFSIVACKKQGALDVTPPSYAEFPTNDTIKTYYVLSTGNSIKIPVGTTTVSNVDRKVNITVTSRAQAGVQYQALPTSITIPAGKAVDSLELKGIFAGLGNGRRDTLTFTITGGDVPANAYRYTYIVYMTRYCTPDLVALAGNYNNTNEYSSSGAFSYGPYTTQLINLTSTGATTATGQLVNLYDDSWNNITANFNWTTFPNLIVTIPLQATGRSYAGGPGGPTSVRTSTATGAVSTFSACDRSLTLDIDLVNGTTVILSKYRFVMK